jgi:hypothetical protein
LVTLRSSVCVLALALGCSGSSKRHEADGEGGTGGTLAGSGASGGGGASGSGAAGGGGGASGSGATGSGATAATPGGGGTAGEPGCGSRGCIGGGQGMPIDPPGPVLCGGVECEAPMACCLSTQSCFDPTLDIESCAPPEQDEDPWGRPVCSSNADCELGFFCQIDSGLCQGTGHCHPIDNCGGCFGEDSDFCQVCGCDGNTYPNQQTACLAQTNVVSVSGGGCGETVQTGGGGSSAGVREFTLCAIDENCAAGQSCCAITGFCYETSDPDRCRVPPEGTRLPCTANEHCNDYEYCLGEGCDGPGGCVSFGSEEDCGVTFELVCGCDGVTYTSPACAASRGVRVATEGECSAG